METVEPFYYRNGQEYKYIEEMHLGFPFWKEEQHPGKSQDNDKPETAQ